MTTKVRFIDHYTKGVKAAAKLPLRVREYPVTYKEDINDYAWKYARKYDDTEHTYDTDGDIAGEYREGVEDTLYELAKDGKRYAVFAWTATHRYPLAAAVSPAFESSSVARQWMLDNMSYDDRYNGGPEKRGHCVRGTYA